GQKLNISASRRGALTSRKDHESPASISQENISMKLIVTEKGEASRRQAKSHELAIIHSLEEARLLETDGARES
uniref:hypothetical protein n=1 Tax=Salmonella enterica TaxID=28901 RepID=UPI0020C4406A